MFRHARRPERVIGLALSGGGSRGAWQVGGMRALEERGIVPELVSGSSAGAINAAWYALRPGELSRLEAVWLSLRQRDIFPGTPFTMLHNVLRRGYLHSSRGLEQLLRRHVGSATFEECSIPCSVVAVRLSDGRRIVFDSGEIVPAVMASAAIPGIFPPYPIGDELYLDGGLLEFLPLGSLWERGANEVYAFDCSYYETGVRTAGWVADRAGRIGSWESVQRDVSDARAAGRQVHLFRPELPEALDSRDFTLTAELIQRGYAHVGMTLDRTANEDTNRSRRRAG